MIKRQFLHDYASIWDKLYYKVWMWINPPSAGNRKYWLYKAWYHSLRYKGRKGQGNSPDGKQDLYLTCEPHKASGIGVCFEGILKGYYAANYWGLNYAYMPLPLREVDEMLGLGEGQKRVDELLRSGYQKVKLPYYDIGNEKEVHIIQEIISSYSGEKVVFYLEVFQPVDTGRGLSIREELQDRFWTSKQRDSAERLYPEQGISVAIHVRRGDIGYQKPEGPLAEWWIELSYYTNVLSWLRDHREVWMRYYPDKRFDEKIHIYLISEGESTSFDEIREWCEENRCELTLLLNESVERSWRYMIESDVLLTGASSFSFNPALFHRGVKISPICRFQYPDDKLWLQADRQGNVKW